MDYPGKIINKNATLPTQASASGVWTVDDALIALRSNTWPIAGVLNPISKSLRFNSADSAYLNRTPASASNRTTWTWSAWVKRGDLSTATRGLFGAGTASSTDTGIYWTSADKIDFFDRSGGSLTGYVSTNAVFRDPSAWYHIVVVFDSGNATAANRMLIYINNVSQSLTVNNTLPQNTQSAVNNTVAHALGSLTGGSNVGNGYMTEVNFIDGQALTPSSFGATDAQTGQWIPKKYTGTYGTNGFYVNFSDSASTGALGTDYSGNGNNWTPNNFSVTAGAGNDSLTDVPTPWIAYSTNSEVGGVVRGNYATWNPLKRFNYNVTLANGNLDTSVTQTASTEVAVANMALPTTGKWYWEVTLQTYTNASADVFLGVCTIANATQNTASTVTSGGGYYRGDGAIRNLSNSAQTSGGTWSQGDIIGIAVDVGAGTVQFYKNNVAQGATPSFSFTAGTELVPYIANDNSANAKVTNLNFGQRPFAYTPPAGYKSLCATNLPTPTIGATTTTQANDYFNVVLWTGTGGGRTITGVGFQPDFVWGKGRSGSATYPNLVWDAVRGTNLNLTTNNTGAEENAVTGTGNGGIGTSASDGFTIVAGTSTADNLNALSPASTYVAWAWKANGSGSTNTAGSITSTVSANTTSGFSIVTWTGNSANATIGHGLGVAPSMVIIKYRGTTDNWYVYNANVGTDKYLVLNATDAAATNTSIWQNTAPTSTVFSIGSGNNNSTIVAYCFAPIAGYSAFGSYTGNSSTDGPFVFCGFRPRYIMWKRTDVANDWVIVDAVRSAYNQTANVLYANVSDAENTAGTGNSCDILSNGFKLRQTNQGSNANGGTYIYAAFAESPFKFANAR
jgi:hypothetical protein